MNKTKPFCISKQLVWESYLRVKTNDGAAGIDGESVEEFEKDLKNNLFKLWNRLSSGSYFPPAVRRVEIPKKNGGTRPLGIPTVSDRIAQMVVKTTLEPMLERSFDKDSYGYRPGKSALEAVGVARERCWEKAWVLDLDIQGFFDNLDHELLLKAVCHHTDNKWVILYLKRWLKAPIALPGGELLYPEKGTPQGGVISPLLANLFLHYGFDAWMRRHYPRQDFERYADDIIVHCGSEEEAVGLRQAIGERLAECKLSLHPQKTKVVYCKSEQRPGNAEHEQFDFLGYTFRPRLCRSRRGDEFVGFTPGVSAKAVKTIRQSVRDWGLPRRCGLEVEDLARELNPVVRGWINYYGAYRKTALYPTLNYLNRMLTRWSMRKYKKLKGRQRKASQWLGQIAIAKPGLFVHWNFVRPSAG